MELSHYEQQMKKAIAYLEGEFAGLQVGRATTGLLENINVETDYGTVKLNTLGHISVMDTTTLKVEPWDKSTSKAIGNAIYEANIAKQVKAMGEDTKTQLRQIRQDAMSDTKKSFTAKEISEDTHKANEKNIDELTKKRSTQIDTVVKVKIDEVMKI